MNKLVHHKEIVSKKDKCLGDASKPSPLSLDDGWHRPPDFRILDQPVVGRPVGRWVMGELTDMMSLLRVKLITCGLQLLGRGFPDCL